MSNSGYNRAGQVGGTLIRRVLGLLKQTQLSLPLTSNILIACSSGPDSVALAHLMVHLGRRISPRAHLHLVHVNHGWRDSASDDEAFVRTLAEKWKLPVHIHQVPRPSENSGESWEDQARTHRKAVFSSLAKQYGARVLTAHHADDLAETLLWRMCTGAWQSHQQGIRVVSGVELRPFLSVRRSEILAYLKEVGQNYRIDPTNEDLRFQRAKMRDVLMPELEKLFPRAIDHLVKIGLGAQLESRLQKLGRAPDQIVSDGVTASTFEGQCDDLISSLNQTLFYPNGLKVRRAQWESILKLESQTGGEAKALCLPGGWELTCRAQKGKVPSKKWTLKEPKHSSYLP